MILVGEDVSSDEDHDIMAIRGVDNSNKYIKTKVTK